MARWIYFALSKKQMEVLANGRYEIGIGINEKAGVRGQNINSVHS